MTIAYSNNTLSPTRLEGKSSGIVICWILGLGSLLSWTSLMTMGDYYYELFPKYHPSRVLPLIYQPIALVTMAILAYNEARIDTRMRNLAGYSLFFLSTFALLVLDLATSRKGFLGNYMSTCAITGALGVADALAIGGMVGDLSLMCPEFIQSFLAGLAASGALTSTLRLMTKAAFEKTNNGLLNGVALFLAISTCIQFLCILLYALIFPKLPIVKHHHRKAAIEGSKTVVTNLAVVGIQTEESERADNNGRQMERLSNKQLLLQNLDYMLDVYLNFALSFSIIPGFLYENTSSHNLGSWYALVLIAIFNVCNLIGRYIPMIEKIKLKSRKGIMIATLSRFLLIPCFYFTSKYGDQGWMMMLVSILGLGYGYLPVCVFTAAPKGYKGPEQNALGNLLALSMPAGIFSGTALGWLWIIGNGQF